MEDLIKLKARAYDLIRTIERTRIELQQIDNAIIKFERNSKPKEEKNS